MKYIIFSFILFFSHAYAQSYIDHLYAPTGFTLESLSGYGYSKTLSDQSNIASSNPASMDRFTSVFLGASYQFENEVMPAYIGNTGSKRYRKDPPQSAGLILPYKNLRLGLGFSQKYNGSLIFGDIPVTTVEQPYGTGLFMNLSEEAFVYRYSALASYGLSDIFNNGDRFTFGLAVNYDKLYYRYSSGIKGMNSERILKSHGDKMSYSLGAEYSIINSEGLRSLFSLYFEKGAGFDKMTTDENVSLMRVVIPGGIEGGRYLGGFTTGNDAAVSKEPDRIHLGFDHSFSELSQITTTLSYVLWNQTMQIKKDQVEAATSYIYSPLNKLFISAGLFWTDQNYNDDALEQSGKYRALFMTTGLVFSYSIVDLDLAAVDSHLLSGKNRKQTIVKVSLGFHL